MPVHRVHGHRGRRLREGAARRPLDTRTPAGPGPAAAGRGQPEPRPGQLGDDVPAPAGLAIVTGQARYTLDVPAEELPGLLHVKLLRSPHAHARIRSIDAAAALAIPGVAAVFTHEDSPAQLFSTAQHELYTDDPDDTRVFDDVVRFTGQRIAAVVAGTVAAAEAGVRALKVDYEVLDAVFTPEDAMLPGAPALHGDKDATTARISRPERNVVAELHSELGDMAAGFAAADFIHEHTYRTQRVQHMALETHASIASIGGDGRLLIRTSSQVPFLVRRTLGRVFGLPEEQIRVVAGRVGGGFGGKQEVLTEDVVALAALKLQPPRAARIHPDRAVHAATTRHPFTIHLKAGASSDGRLTALQLEVLTNTGAYGNHAAGRDVPRLRRIAGRVQVRQQEGGRPRGVHQHRAVRCLPRLRAEPDDLRDRVRPSTSSPPGSAWTRWSSAAATWSAKATTCSPPTPSRKRTSATAATAWTSARELVEDALARGRERYRAAGLDDLGPDWVVGEGTALSMIDTVPPRGHFAHSRLRLLPDGTLRGRRRDRRIRQRHHHRPRPARGHRAVHHRRPRHASGSPTPTSWTTIPARSARPAPWWPARRRWPPPRTSPCRIRAFAAGIRRVPPSGCVLDGGRRDLRGNPGAR